MLLSRSDSAGRPASRQANLTPDRVRCVIVMSLPKYYDIVRTCGRCVGRQGSRHGFLSDGHRVDCGRYFAVAVAVVAGFWRWRRRGCRRRHGAAVCRCRRFFPAGPRSTPLAETQSHKGSHCSRSHMPRGLVISMNKIYKKKKEKKRGQQRERRTQRER